VAKIDLKSVIGALRGDRKVLKRVGRQLAKKVRKLDAAPSKGEATVKTVKSVLAAKDPKKTFETSVVLPAVKKLSEPGGAERLGKLLGSDRRGKVELASMGKTLSASERQGIDRRNSLEDMLAKKGVYPTSRLPKEFRLSDRKRVSGKYYKSGYGGVEAQYPSLEKALRSNRFIADGRSGWRQKEGIGAKIAKGLSGLPVAGGDVPGMSRKQAQAAGVPTLTVGDVLEGSNRVSRASAGATLAVLNDENVLDRVKKNLSGKKSDTWVGVAKKAGVKNKYLQTALGFAGSMATDPLSYVPIAAPAKVASRARFGKNVTGSTPRLAWNVEKLAENKRVAAVRQNQKEKVSKELAAKRLKDTQLEIDRVQKMLKVDTGNRGRIVPEKNVRRKNVPRKQVDRYEKDRSARSGLTGDMREKFIESNVGQLLRTVSPAIRPKDLSQSDYDVIRQLNREFRAGKQNAGRDVIEQLGTQLAKGDRKKLYADKSSGRKRIFGRLGKRNNIVLPEADSVRAKLFSAVEAGDKDWAVKKGLGEVYDLLGSVGKQLYKDERKAGINYAERQNYLTHYIADDVAAILGGKRKSGVTKRQAAVGSVLGNVKPRSFANLADRDFAVAKKIVAESLLAKGVGKKNLDAKAASFLEDYVVRKGLVDRKQFTVPQLREKVRRDGTKLLPMIKKEVSAAFPEDAAAWIKYAEAQAPERLRDPIVASGLRAKASGIAIAKNRYIKDVFEEVGTPIPSDVLAAYSRGDNQANEFLRRYQNDEKYGLYRLEPNKAGVVPMPVEVKRRDIPGLLRGSNKTQAKTVAEVRVMPRRAIEEMKRQLESAGKDTTRLGRGLAEFTGGAKRILTLSPSYHVTNIIGDTWAAKAAGTRFKTLLKTLKKNKGTVKIDGRTVLLKDLHDEAVDMGALGSGRFRGDISNQRGLSKLMREEVRGLQSSNKGRARAKASAKLENLNVARENAPRFATYVESRMRGLSPRQAAAYTAKHHIDYGEISKSEQALRILFPFYTFTARNLPLQAELAVRNPRMLVGQSNLQKSSAEAQGNVDRKDLPLWMQKEMPLSVGKDKFWGTKLPVSDALYLQNPVDRAGSMLNPAAKIPLELALNKSFFFKRPIKDSERGRALVNAPEAVKLLPKGLKDMLGVKVDAAGQLKYSPYADYILKQTPQTSMLLQAGTKGKSRAGMDADLALLSSLSGVRVREMTAEEVKLNKLFEKLEQVKKQIDEKRSLKLLKSGEGKMLQAKQRGLIDQISGLNKSLMVPVKPVGGSSVPAGSGFSIPQTTYTGAK